MRTWDGERWVSNLLRSEAELPLEKRWLSIPANVWHQPVMGDVDRSVISFHTASDTALIEELPIDDEQPDRGSRAAMGIRTARRADLDSASAARFPGLIQVLSTPRASQTLAGE